jgi:hypothetical protein
MVKKIDELINLPEDPNSPESQEFLRKLHDENLMAINELKSIIAQWKEEDKRDEAK